MQVALELSGEHHVHENCGQQKCRQEAGSKFCERLGASGPFRAVSRLQIETGNLLIDSSDGVTDTDSGFDIRNQSDLALASHPFDLGGAKVVVKAHKVR